MCERGEGSREREGRKETKRKNMIYLKEKEEKEEKQEKEEERKMYTCEKIRKKVKRKGYISKKAG